MGFACVWSVVALVFIGLGLISVLDPNRAMSLSRTITAEFFGYELEPAEDSLVGNCWIVFSGLASLAIGFAMLGAVIANLL
jgi:hypothetical protein